MLIDADWFWLMLIDTDPLDVHFCCCCCWWCCSCCCWHVAIDILLYFHTLKLRQLPFTQRQKSGWSTQRLCRQGNPGQNITLTMETKGSQLFGQPASSDTGWKDGLISRCFRFHFFIQVFANTLNKCINREFSSCPSDCQRLLVFDGPLDMDWVENFNTLLDKNQVPTIISYFAYCQLICCRCFVLSLGSARLSAQECGSSLRRPVLQTFLLQLCPVVLWSVSLNTVISTNMQPPNYSIGAFRSPSIHSTHPLLSV